MRNVILFMLLFLFVDAGLFCMDKSCEESSAKKTETRFEISYKQGVSFSVRMTDSFSICCARWDYGEEGVFSYCNLKTSFGWKSAVTFAGEKDPFGGVDAVEEHLKKIMKKYSSHEEILSLFRKYGKQGNIEVSSGGFKNILKECDEN